MTDYDNFQNYQTNLEDNIELRKAISKLEDLLTRKHAENENLLRINQDLKIMLEKGKKECTDLSQKLIHAYGEKKMEEKKYESEITRLKSYFEKQKEVYESQILKLSVQDSETLKNKITAEVELKQKHLIQQKELEIDSLNDQIFDWKKKFELLNTEYDTFKNDALREIDMIKENHKSEVKEFLYKIQLLNEKCESNVDKESYRNMRQELDAYRRNFNDLQQEVSNLRKEKDLLMVEKNEIKINLFKELDQEKLKLKMISNDNEKFTQTIKNYENELGSLKNKLDEKNEEIKNLINEKFLLTKELRHTESEFENFKNEIRLLRGKVNERDKEYEDNLKINHEKEKQRFMNEKFEKEEYQRKIEELTNNLRDVQLDFKNFYEKSNEELHSAKRDFYIVQEEKRNLIRRVTELQQDIELFRDDYEKTKKTVEYYEKEYSRLDGQYRDLCAKEAENHRMRLGMENEINKRTDEINHLSTLLKMYEGEKNSVSEKIGAQYKGKMEALLKKKKHYKKQCVVYNQKLAMIIQKLKRNQNIDSNEFNMNILDDNENAMSQSEESIH